MNSYELATNSPERKTVLKCEKTNKKLYVPEE